MEFSDIFFVIIVPILSATLTGFAVNFFVKLKAAMRINPLQEEIERQQERYSLSQNQLAETQDMSDARGLILLRWQNEYLEPLLDIRKNCGLEQVIDFNDEAKFLEKKDKKALDSIFAEVEELRTAKVQILPEVLHNLGLVLFAAGDTENAIMFFRDAIEVDSTSQDARANLGVIFLRNGNFDEAAQEFQELIEIAHHRFDGHFGLGLALMGSSKIDDCIESLSTAIRLKPEHAQTYCELCKAYVEIGEIDRAMENVKVALKLSPKLYEGKIIQQQLLIRMGRFQEAIDICRSFLVKNEDAGAFYNMASAYALDGQEDSALNKLNKAIRLDDNFRFRAKDDRTFDSLRNSRRFKDLMDGKPGLF